MGTAGLHLGKVEKEGLLGRGAQRDDPEGVKKGCVRTLRREQSSISG